MDQANLKLGMLPSPKDHRTLLMSDYLADELVPPTSIKNSARCKPPWKMFRNDEIGDCTCASFGHALQVWTAGGSREVEVSDQDVVSMYEVVGGYNPADPRTDRGAMPINALRYMRDRGMAGHKIKAFAAIDPSDIDTIKRTIWLFGCVYYGIQLPKAWQNQKAWLAPTNPNALFYPQYGKWRPGTWGGHAVMAPDYDETGSYPVTWNTQLRMSWAVNQFPNLQAFSTYVTEAWAPLSPDWIDAATKKAPNGFAGKDLLADLAKIGHVMKTDDAQLELC